MLDKLRDLNYPGAMVIVALIAGLVCAIIFGPPEYWQAIAGSGVVTTLIAFWIKTHKAPKPEEPPHPSTSGTRGPS